MDDLTLKSTHEQLYIVSRKVEYCLCNFAIYNSSRKLKPKLRQRASSDVSCMHTHVHGRCMITWFTPLTGSTLGSVVWTDWTCDGVEREKSRCIQQTSTWRHIWRKCQSWLACTSLAKISRLALVKLWGSNFIYRKISVVAFLDDYKEN